MALAGAAQGAALDARWSGRRIVTRAALAQGTLAALVAGAVALGIGMRVWYLLHDPIDADQAMIGILARQILAGHLHAFLLGQPYGGVGPYLVAGVFAVFHSSPVALGMPVLVSDGAACVLVWRVARRLCHRGDVAAVCAAAMWVAPQSVVWNSTMEYGFRGVTLLCGTAMLLVALRLYQGSSRWWDAPLLGALTGLGWWSSPEIVYFAVPAGIWTAGWLWHAWRARRVRRDAPLAAAGALAAGIGALPWLWANATTGFPSLALSAYDAPHAAPPYATRLGDLFHGALPMVLDLRVPRTGAWVLPVGVAVAVLVAVGAAVAGAVAWLLWRRAEGAAVALGVLAYVFVLAAAPSSADWLSGRYTNFLVPLLVLLAAALVGEVQRVRAVAGRAPATGPLRPRAALGTSAVLAALISLSMVSFGALQVANVLPGSQLGASPEQPARALATSLERAGVRGGYADYWVAYKLDFLTGGRLQLADTPPSPDRLPALQAAVRALPARRQAWIFVTPTTTARTEYADTAVIRGPSGLALATFLADLGRLGVGYRVLHVEGATAVICARPVTPADVGLRRAPTG